MTLSAEAKRQLLAQRLEEKAAQTRRELPLSYGQEALWFLHQQAPESAAYNTAFALRIRSEIDTAVLHRALRQLILRHESLRTVFPVVNGRPAQAVYGYRPPVFEQIAVASFIREEIEAVYQRPFDLENGPLFRAHLFTRSKDDHILLLGFHHIICDAWAIWVLVDELGQLLAAAHAGQNVTLPPAPTYETFIHWQAERVQQPGLLAYWQTQLAGELPQLNLPTDKPRSTTTRGASHFFNLDAALTERVKAQAQAMGVTPFMFLLAVFQILLYRYAGQEDLIVGSPTSGRGRADFANLVGYLVNPIPLRADLSDNPSFADFLQRTRRTVLDGLAHQDYPLPLLARKLPRRQASHTSPLFQSLFVYQKPQFVLQTIDGRFAWGGLLVEPYEITQMEGQFELTLEVTEQTAVYQAIFKYDPDLWTAETIARMAGHWQTLLAGAVAKPDYPIDQLPLLSEAEQQQILVEFNDTARDYPTEFCLHQLFEQQVERTPTRTAVTFRNQSLTYAQLNRRANQLAHYLQSRGVGPETLVSVCAERSLEMVIALYAILKAGGAYVPLDPTYPAERLRFMLTDARTPILLTQSHLISQLPTIESVKNQESNAASSAIQFFALDTADLAAYPDHNPTGDVKPHNLAYMIYTSGSTGQPKGALNQHSGIVNRLLWMQETYQLDESDRVLQKTPFSFDVSVWEFFWPLLAGATLVVAEPEGHRDDRYLIETIHSQEISTLHFVPSMLTLFLQEISRRQTADKTSSFFPLPSSFPSLRRVICSGEALPYSLQEQFFATLPNVELHNLYGPTEAAVDVTCWPCLPGDPRGYVPIGRPVTNTQIYIVDRHNQPVPIGVPGELLIGGVQVGRGYWQRSELTELRFTNYKLRKTDTAFVLRPSFLQQAQNKLFRLYRTGDLARWRADGVIEYLGRLDFQVKLRGFRIELGEIEAALLAHSSVVQAVVIAPNKERLLAYLVADGPVTAVHLRQFLRQTLPDYMIPAGFVFLEELPLSPNGKVNRRALSLPENNRPAMPKGKVAAQTAVEQQIAAIWQEVLELPQAGIHDNFFDLGGHSLLLAQVRLKLEEIYGRSFSITTLFQYPTIYTLAAYLSEEDAAAAPGNRINQRLSRRATLQDQRETRLSMRRHRKA